MSAMKHFWKVLALLLVLAIILAILLNSRVTISSDDLVSIVRILYQ